MYEIELQKYDYYINISKNKNLSEFYVAQFLIIRYYYTNVYINCIQPV